jgi:uncharacterized protein (DUF1778 family)
MKHLQTNQGKKDGYVHLRITQGDKERIELGASLTGVHPSEYIRRHALEAARNDIEMHTVQNRIVLHTDDWDRFMAVMEENEKPLNQNLQKAFEGLNEFESGN